MMINADGPFYSQCCPYVGVRLALRTALSHFFNLYLSTGVGLLSMHATVPCFTHIHTWKLPTTIIFLQGAAPLKELKLTSDALRLSP